MKTETKREQIMGGEREREKEGARGREREVGLKDRDNEDVTLRQPQHLRLEWGT